MEHQNSSVRLEALNVLQKLGREDAHAIRRASSLLGHRMEAVRQTGIRALCMLADGGNADAVQAASRFLQEPSPAPVRGAALQALSKIAAKGDQETMALLSVFTLDEEQGVRFQAVNAISRLAQKGDVRAVTAVFDCLGDDAPQVRVAALRTLRTIAAPDHRLLTTVREMLRDEDEMVRDEAADLLANAEA
eukprot:TRINITY_DN37796_c0_g1_i1.p1 TRINITY_DN37796_c0_g1~~TRINITY_DN37796_c0_g1_i1.p1  ORF type:complete len:191 (+),score=39.12 TRINITY_DN37796_c0_g1_i1:341-913(+)